MKQYLAKYLPVEGEIKDGDRVFMKTGHGEKVVTCKNKEQASLWNSLNPKPSIVELFLCTEDKPNFFKENYEGLITDGNVLGRYFGDIDGDSCIESPVGSGIWWRDPSGFHKVIGKLKPAFSVMSGEIVYNNQGSSFKVNKRDGNTLWIQWGTGEIIVPIHDYYVVEI